MTTIENEIMGTGSRSVLTHPDVREIYTKTETFVVDLFKRRPETVLISGMAEGWDEIIATIGLRNNIPYICAIPHRGYGQYYWGEHSLLGVNRMPKFNQLVEGAREVVYVCNSIYVNGVHSNFIRNTWMVNKCKGALVYDASSRGTKDAVSKLKKAGKPFMVYPF